MCSMNGGQLGRICRAIDELAADSASADRGAGESAPAASEDGMAHGGAAHQDGAADQDRPADRAGPADLGRDGAERRAGRDAADIARLAAIWEMGSLAFRPDTSGASGLQGTCGNSWAVTGSRSKETGALEPGFVRGSAAARCGMSTSWAPQAWWSPQNAKTATEWPT